MIVLLLAPWMLLTLTGGGIHNHASLAPPAAVTARSAAGDSGRQGEPARLHSNDSAGRDAPCAACLWQLHSNGAAPAPPVAVTALPAAASFSTCPAQVSAAEARSFDPRAPPLS